jgi:metal-responsive CopG/Arc/MetJ family transcriptional regulator
MRIKTNIIIEEEVMKQIDAIAGDKPKRAAVVELALREFIARHQKKIAKNPAAAIAPKKVVSAAKRGRK